MYEYFVAFHIPSASKVGNTTVELLKPVRGDADVRLIERLVREHTGYAGVIVTFLLRIDDPTGQPATPGEALRRAAAQLAQGSVWADPSGRWNASQAEAAGAQKQLMVDRLNDLAAELDRAAGG